MITGRAWIFGDDISTDFILPGPALILPPMEQVRWIFQANRPGWVDEAKPGDIIIAGKNFGVGSSRPAARSLKNLGIACVIAETMNRLFFRNCVNFGLIGLECPGITKAVSEGDTIEVSETDARIRNVTTGEALQGSAVPPALLELMCNGGVYPLLERQGYIAPKPPQQNTSPSLAPPAPAS